MENFKPGVYKHYKGKYYLALGIATHSETEEVFVVYVHLYSRKGTAMWIRPFEMFTGDVVINGKTQKRFAYVGQEMPEEI